MESNKIIELNFKEVYTLTGVLNQSILEIENMIEIYQADEDYKGRNKTIQFLEDTRTTYQNIIDKIKY